jgi:hypothetical protein
VNGCQNPRIDGATLATCRIRPRGWSVVKRPEAVKSKIIKVMLAVAAAGRVDMWATLFALSTYPQDWGMSRAGFLRQSIRCSSAESPDDEGGHRSGGARMSKEAFESTNAIRGTARLFLCARCRAQVVICRDCDRGQIYCTSRCAQDARRNAQRAAGRTLSSERSWSSRPRFASAALSRAAEKRDASWFTTSGWNVLAGGCRSFTWPREREAIDMGLP